MAASNSPAEKLLTDNLDIWTSAIKKRGSQGRGSSKKIELYGIKKLRELILELAVRGLLVPQDPNDEPASVLLEKIAAEKEQLIKDGKIKKQKALSPVKVDEELFKLPVGWAWSRIGEFSLIGPRNILDDDLEVSFVPMPLISTSYKGDHEQEVRFWSELKKGYTHFANGDIGLAKITPCFENSKASIFSDLKNGFGAGTTELHIARPLLEEINPLFVLLYLKAPMFLEVGKTKMTGSAGQKRIPKSFFEGNPFPLPPEAEQHRIVAKVDELMALCDQLEQQTETSLTAHQTLVETLLNTLLNADQNSFNPAWERIAQHFDALFTTEHSIDQLKQTILQLAVMGKLVPQDPNDEPASVLLEKIAAEKEKLIKDKVIKKSQSTDEIIQGNCNWSIPETWSIIELQDLFRFIDYRGKNPQKSESGKRLITAKNIRNGYIKNEPVEFISDNLYETWMVRGFPQLGDLLFVTEGHTMGFVASVDMKYEFALAQRTICLHPFFNVDRRFFLHAIMSQKFQCIVRDNQTGSAAGGIKASKLKRVPIPIPPESELNRISRKVDELMTLCNTLKLRIHESQKTQLHLADAMAEQALN